MAAGFIEEISNESGSAFTAQANQKKPPTAASPPSPPTSVPSAAAGEKKAAQFQYQLKMEDDSNKFSYAVDNPAHSVVCISEIAAKELGLPFSTDLQLSMRDANGGTKATFGIIKNLELTIGGVSICVHTWIIKDAPYHLLLG
ncbi:hypothetical protein M422DRAFT_265521 [Sphaerobolus stellatus SS14]|uniref:Uncharacterized protein n=1 Tax=Sphaerobolus stellatus (strain SS14) TaxID=990650 RepID=A0A0C9UD42_SPHS4|nr:hypothetical protein M422DRAFT_265521 [Sphaerobolus stellatus SS14]